MNQATLDHAMIALAHPARRAILTRLSKGEARVTELAKPFDMSLNAVSKHILILERADLVRRRREGREHYLTANLDPLGDITDWIDQYRKLWHDKLNKLDEYLQELQANQQKVNNGKGKHNGRKR
ncbi:MAG: metalloregulator ArsR/SmtB family transcription factor [Ignavibacteriae bacterium]|nr:metalloregulator ArsR/SmtB family transcription factor [Ignavibacteriota bacterium]